MKTCENIFRSRPPSFDRSISQPVLDLYLEYELFFQDLFHKPTCSFELSCPWAEIPSQKIDFMHGFYFFLHDCWSFLPKFTTDSFLVMHRSFYISKLNIFNKRIPFWWLLLSTRSFKSWFRRSSFFLFNLVLLYFAIILIGLTIIHFSLIIVIDNKRGFRIKNRRKLFICHVTSVNIFDSFVFKEYCMTFLSIWSQVCTQMCHYHNWRICISLSWH